MGAAFDSSTLEAAFGASEDAVFSKDRHGRYLSINPAGARMVGRSAADIVGRTDAEVFAGVTAQKMAARDRAIMDSGTVETYEDTGVLDGRTRWYRSTKGPRLGPDGTVDGLWGVSRDITDERTNRAEREQLALELQARLEELAATEAKLAHSERLASLGRLAAVLAHEIRNPLAVILNATAIARRNVIAQPGEAIFDIIEEEVATLNNLVTGLLDFARPSSAVLVPRELGDVVKSVVERVLVGHASKGLGVRVVGADVPTIARVDERLLIRALLNVVENACQAMEAGGVLTVTLTTGPGVARVSVVDTGGGLTELARKNLFQPFFTTKATGTGLGLYVVKRILDDHGGEIDVVSDEAGTSVTLALPIVHGG